jgi:hypothetical protein
MYGFALSKGMIGSSKYVVILMDDGGIPVSVMDPSLLERSPGSLRTAQV